jgi:hypothetical protein
MFSAFSRPNTFDNHRLCRYQSKFCLDNGKDGGYQIVIKGIGVT